MKRPLSITGLFFTFLLLTNAALSFPRMADTLTKPKGNLVNDLFMIGKSTFKGDQTPDNHNVYMPFRGHWSGFNYGFIRFTNTDYSMYDTESNGFMDLDWSHSFALQFNLLKYSINLAPRNNYGLVCGLGLEYQRMRFDRNDLSIKKMDGRIEPFPLYEQETFDHAKRSTFKTLYLTLPLLMEIQFPVNQPKRMYVSGGFTGGIRMHSKTKVIYKDTEGKEHKAKEKGSFNTVPFKVDAVAKIGYGCINLWGSYTLTRMFESGKGPKLHPYTLGIGISF